MLRHCSTSVRYTGREAWTTANVCTCLNCEFVPFFHVNAHAFQSGITAGKNAITKILITAVADQVDVIVCDANQFTNRKTSGPIDMPIRRPALSLPSLTRSLFQRTKSVSRASVSLNTGRSQPSPLSSSPLWKVWMPIATACCRSS